MGKKSKKKSKTSTSVGDLHQNQQQQQQQDQQQELSNNRERTLTEQLGGLALDTVEKAISDGAACHFCLDEEDDEMGKPVVRDCSCRGNDAGYAHLSCMIKYAQQKSTSLVGKSDFADSWRLCLNCKQPFKNQLALEMSSACLSFTESTYGHPRQSIIDKLFVMIALRLRIVSIVTFKVECLTVALCQEIVPVDEGKLLSKKLLSMIEQIKKEKQVPYRKMMEIRCEFEARTYTYLGVLTSDCLDSCIAYYEKALDIYQLFGVKDQAKACQSSIDALQSELDQDRLSADHTLMKSFKSFYECSIEINGSMAEQTIRCGLTYVEQLRKMRHGIEAERLVMKLAAHSCRVHGPEHNCTVMVNLLLEKCKKRFVMHDKKIFEALSYEDDKKNCVITGPVTEPRQADKERILRVSICLIVPLPCCTVVCTGLVSSPHINGKLGDVRDGKLVGKTFRVDVHFEDAELKPARVRPENLRIAFKLPCNHGAD